MDPAVFFFTVIASTEGYFIALALLVLILVYRNQRQRALLLAGTGFGLAASVPIIKQLIADPRPMGALIEVSGYGFPSGHAAGATFLALAVCILIVHLSQPLRYIGYFISIALALTIAFSRIYYAAHTPMQVTAGIILAAVWALLFYYLQRK